MSLSLSKCETWLEIDSLLHHFQKVKLGLLVAVWTDFGRPGISVTPDLPLATSAYSGRPVESPIASQ